MKAELKCEARREEGRRQRIDFSMLARIRDPVSCYLVWLEIVRFISMFRIAEKTSKAPSTR